MKQKYWDALAKNFSTDVLEISDCDLDGVILKTASRLGGKKKQAVDFGCGAGAVTRAVAPYFGAVLGLDFSKDLLARARDLTRAANISYEWADLGAARAKRYPCDVAFCANVLIADDAKLRERIARNVIRNVKKGGAAVFIAPSFESALRVYQVAFNCQIKDGVARDLALRDVKGWIREEIASLPEGVVRVGGVKTKHYMADELSELLERCSLSDIALSRVSYPWSEMLDNAPRNLKSAPPWDWMAVGFKR